MFTAFGTDSFARLSLAGNSLRTVQIFDRVERLFSSLPSTRGNTRRGIGSFGAGLENPGAWFKMFIGEWYKSR